MNLINWFDLLAIALLIVGIFHGRKRGMSLELLPLLQLLIIVVVGSRLAGPIGQKLMEWTNGTMSPLAAAVVAYVLFAFIVHMVFGRIKRAVGEKLVGSDIFGRMEYYFGMLAGALRYGCYVLIGIAILNAKPIDYEHEKAYRKTEKDNLGNISFPTYTSVQIDVFDKSQVGKFTKANINHLLLTPVTGQGAKKSEAIARRRERAVEEVMSSSTSSASSATEAAPPKAQ